MPHYGRPKNNLHAYRIRIYNRQILQSNHCNKPTHEKQCTGLSLYSDVPCAHTEPVSGETILADFFKACVLSRKWRQMLRPSPRLQENHQQRNNWWESRKNTPPMFWGEGGRTRSPHILLYAKGASAPPPPQTKLKVASGLPINLFLIRIPITKRIIGTA